MASVTNASNVQVFQIATHTFHFMEYVSFGSLLIVSIIIGIYYGCIKGNQNTVTEYMLAGKNMQIFPIAMSLITSHVSGITILGNPSEVYEFGAQYMVSVLGIMVVVYITNTFYMPIFYSLQVCSVYEYLEMRFSKTARKIASLIFAVFLVVYVPIVIYLPALAFEQITGISLHWMTPVICFVCIFYTAIGGLKAVVWTDAIQGIFTLVAVIVVIVLGISKIGSLQQVLKISSEGDRLQFFNFDASPFSRATFWGTTIGSIFLWTSILTLHPGSTQRFVALPTMEAAKKSVIWFGVGVCLLNLITSFLGLIMYSHYWKCDPLEAKIVKIVAQVLPHYVKEIGIGVPGLTGLFLAGLTSSALSTMSAAMNTVSGTLYEDFVKNWMPNGTTEATASSIMKVLVVTFGIICIFLIYIVEKFGGIVQMAFSLGSAPNGAVFAVFALGLFFPWANSKGAICGMIGSLAFSAWLTIRTQMARVGHKIINKGKPLSTEGCVNNTTIFKNEEVLPLTKFRQIGDATYIADDVNPIYATSFLYYTLIGAVIGISIGLLVSFLTGTTDLKTLNPKLIAPGVRNILPRYKKNNERDMDGNDTIETVALDEINLENNQNNA